MNPSELYYKAVKAGQQAAAKCNPTPMTVQQHASPFNDTSPIVKEWYVPDGVCGFAWVRLTPARGKFVAWLKLNGIGSGDSYAGGYSIWIHNYNQSMQRKEAHARAMADVLNEAGLVAYAESRID